MKKLFQSPPVQCFILLAGALVAVVFNTQDHSEAIPSRPSGDPLRPLHISRDHPASRSRSPLPVTAAGGKESARQTAMLPRGADAPQVSTPQSHSSRSRDISGPAEEEFRNDSSLQEQAAVAPAVIEEARIPVARAIPDLDISRFSPREQSAIRSLLDSFARAVAAAPSQDPDSPEYFNCWKSALRLHDEQLRITLGWDRYNSLSALAARDALPVP